MDSIQKPGVALPHSEKTLLSRLFLNVIFMSSPCPYSVLSVEIETEALLLNIRNFNLLESHIPFPAVRKQEFP